MIIIEIKESTKGSWHLRLKANNGEITFASETYYKKSNAKHAAITFTEEIKDSASFMIVEVPLGSSSPAKVTPKKK